MLLFKRAIYLAPKVVFFPLRAVYERAVGALVHTQMIEGVKVGVMNAEIGEALWTKVATALALIHRLDPARYARIVRDVRRIVVMRAPSAAFWVSSATCVLDEKAVAERSAALIALAIVHEATHGRIQRMGVGIWPDTIDRIEALCIRQEISFARQLPREQYPGTDTLIAHLTELRRRRAAVG